MDPKHLMPKALVSAQVLSPNPEYDALPGLGHACGHNLIAISSIGAALAAKELLSKYPANMRIIIYGTPGHCA
jgi:metal-dependent amidase/aminoacylase/carboxypeptidase family protein